jgi:hypothetical protein
MNTQLTPQESTLLAQCESTIRSGLDKFVAVGLALATVRDERLYRAEFDTFEAYAETRWNISRRRAYQFIDAAPVAQELATQGITVNEAQARALASVPAEQRAEVYEQAAASGKVTAASIGNAAKSTTTTETACEKDFTKLATAISRDTEQLIMSLALIPDERMEVIEENLRFVFEEVELRFLESHPERAAIVEKPLRRILAKIEELKGVAA